MRTRFFLHENMPFILIFKRLLKKKPYSAITLIAPQDSALQVSSVIIVMIKLFANYDIYPARVCASGVKQSVLPVCRCRLS